MIEKIDGLWTLGLDAWVIQDGNYGDFQRGQVAEFAVEFRFAQPPERVVREGPEAIHVSRSTYDLEAEVLAVFEGAWVLDCGIGVFQDGMPPESIAVGDFVSGRAYLGVDPFYYREGLEALAGMPALIYTWRIERLLMETAPYTEVEGGLLMRDLSKSDPIAIETTCARRDDNGRANYYLACTRLGVPAKRSTTAV